MLFDYIDKMLLEIFERFSHDVQEWTGINNFEQARWVTRLFILACLGQYLFIIYEVPVTPILDSVWFLLMRHKIRLGESSVDMSVDNPTRNKMAISHYEQGVRLFWLILFSCVVIISIRGWIIANGNGIITPFIFLNIGKYSCTVITIYLAACTPKPPGKSKVRKFVEGIGKKLRNLIPSPEPVPAPA